ncbi:response regulator [Halovenus halobia]|uniref:response regulator n=1 Tax=Halovenus halobia TaxID=3396622 RepID=UPI003F55FB75
MRDRWTLSRSVLRGSRRATREQSPLLRNESPGQLEDEPLEFAIPAATVDEPAEIRVLHVDDDPQIVELTGEFLERTDDAFWVTGETTAVEGLNQLRDGEFDCIVSDYDMPQTDGLEFLELVREQFPDIPFILYTAKGSEEVASEAISAGVTEYMQKETNTEQYEVLANRIRNAVDRYRSQQQFWDALSWYHQLVERGIAGVFVVQDGEVVYANEQLAEIFDCLRSDLLGESPDTLAGTASASETLSELSAHDGCHSFDRTFTGQYGDGPSVTVELHGGTIQYSNEPACIGVLWPVDS